jgi:hypothetical protein
VIDKQDTDCKKDRSSIIKGPGSTVPNARGKIIVKRKILYGSGYGFRAAVGGMRNKNPVFSD